MKNFRILCGQQLSKLSKSIHLGIFPFLTFLVPEEKFSKYLDLSPIHLRVLSFLAFLIPEEKFTNYLDLSPIHPRVFSFLAFFIPIRNFFKLFHRRRREEQEYVSYGDVCRFIPRLCVCKFFMMEWDQSFILFIFIYVQRFFRIVCDLF